MQYRRRVLGSDGSRTRPVGDAGFSRKELRVHKSTSIITSIIITVALSLGGSAAADATPTPADNGNHSYTVITAAMPKSMIQDALRHDPALSPNQASLVGSRWQDYKDRLVVLRVAAQSKIYFKHNLNRTAVRVATQQPDSGRLEYGSTWEYITTFLKVEKDGSVSDSQKVRTLVDFRNVDGDPQGVITSYCLGIEGACPAWVDETVG
jgi:hypothetical protein